MQETRTAPTHCQPAGLTQQLQTMPDGCLHLVGDRIAWFLYVCNGALCYATNSADPFERLERHLRSQPPHSPLAETHLRAEVRQQFDGAELRGGLSADYQALTWLLAQGHCDRQTLTGLVRGLSIEVLEGFLMLPEDDYDLQQIPLGELASLPQLPLEPLLEEVRDRLDQWNALAPRITSSYQRPYLIGETLARQRLSPSMANKLSRLLLGFNFRQLGMLLQQDELALCQRFMPLIRDGIIVLREPLAPHDRLSPFDPIHCRRRSPAAEAMPALDSQSGPDSGFLSVHADTTEQRCWKIACIDDSPAVLREIQRFLQQEIFEITLIDDSQKALMKIISLKPDLILLDAGMPGLDGYQVCTMIRKSSVLRHIPVIMVTGNKGLLDRARAKLAGTTDYLTKPFSQKDLLQIVLRYLSD